MPGDIHWNLGRARADDSQSASCVSDYRAVNKQIEWLPGVMPNQEAGMVWVGDIVWWGGLMEMIR